ncbi:MAG: hypothetical protein U1A23_04100, partial [Candidatus Sungbacteria bacterium]|nr:hypothetical protein [Candidatus Sungbacteria bacterium]
MAHRFTADCENPFCLFIAEGIEAQTPEEAGEIALLLHEGYQKRQVALGSVNCLPEPDLTIRNDFPCQECFDSDEEEE